MKYDVISVVTRLNNEFELPIEQFADVQTGSKAKTLVTGTAAQTAHAWSETMAMAWDANVIGQESHFAATQWDSLHNVEGLKTRPVATRLASIAQTSCIVNAAIDAAKKFPDQFNRRTHKSIVLDSDVCNRAGKKGYTGNFEPCELDASWDTRKGRRNASEDSFMGLLRNVIDRELPKETGLRYAGNGVFEEFEHTDIPADAFNALQSETTAFVNAVPYEAVLPALNSLCSASLPAHVIAAAVNELRRETSMWDDSEDTRWAEGLNLWGAIRLTVKLFNAANRDDMEQSRAWALRVLCCLVRLNKANAQLSDDDVVTVAANSAARHIGRKANTIVEECNGDQRKLANALLDVSALVKFFAPVWVQATGVETTDKEIAAAVKPATELPDWAKEF